MWVRLGNEDEEPVNAVDLWPGDPSRRALWEQMLAWLDPQPGEYVLDVGCGRGVAVADIAERVAPNGRAIGLEPVVEHLAALSAAYPAAHSAAYPAVEMAGPFGVCGDAQALPFADDSFDAALSVNVLEAIPDRARALAEMQRVLKPGGRALVAHGDYESQVYAGADRELTRRVVLAYASSKFKSYATSDGQMGRHLWGLFSRAGFVDAEARVIPLVNTEYREPLTGWANAQFSAALVAAVSDLTQAEIDRWHAELAAASERGDYLYCLSHYVCSGRKPNSSRR